MNPHHHSHSQNQSLILSLLVLFLAFSLSACSTHDSFSGHDVLDYGDLRVSVLETGFDRIRDGFICDDSNYGHPYATLSFTCTEEANSDCKFSVLVEVKYTNGASWGLGYFSNSNSSYLPQNLTLSPGESIEETFENRSTGKQCWSKSEPVRKIIIALRDRSGELKDLSASYKP